MTAAVSALLGPMLLFLVLRGPALEHGIAMGQILAAEKGYALQVSGAQWQGISGWKADRIFISGPAGELNISGTSGSWKVNSPQNGGIALADLNWESATFAQSESQKISGNSASKSQTNFQAISGKLNALSQILPSEFHLSNTRISLKGQSFHFPEIVQSCGILRGRMETGEKIHAFSGRFEPDHAKLSVRFPELETSKISLSNAEFDIRLASASAASISVFCDRVRMNEKRIAPEPLEINDFSTGWRFAIAQNGIQSLRGAQVRAGEFVANPHFAIVSDDSLSIFGGISFPKQPVEALLSALPAEMLPALQTLEPSGTAGGKVSLKINPENLETLEISGEWQPENLEVSSRGRKKIQELAARSHQVSLAGVPAVTEKVMLLSEDPRFYQHAGIDDIGIRLALKDNLAAGRFVRGGGTVTMQWVRNTLLSPEKNILRKIDESLTALLIEEKNVLTKSEIFESYLNLAEFDSDVRGISQASAHFFRKNPAELKTDESIFLAAVLPNPDAWASLFEDSGTLSPFGQSYFQSMRWLLYDAEVISEAEWEAPLPDVRLIRRKKSGTSASSAQSGS